MTGGWDPAWAIAQHEAAHTVVAQALGVFVHSARIIDRRGFGQTLIANNQPPRISAAIDVAGDVWDKAFSDQEYRDVSCDDLRNAVEQVSEAGIWAARRRATRILDRHQDEILHLAKLLLERGTLVFTAAR